VNQGPRWDFDENTRGQKSRDTVPLSIKFIKNWIFSSEDHCTPVYYAVLGIVFLLYTFTKFHILILKL
jgi:hypothetical protein